MSRDDDAAEKSDRPRSLTASFLLKPRRSVIVESELLGALGVSELTHAMATTLVERLPANDSLSDAEVARIFMGCVAVATGHDGEQAATPLSATQAGKLSDADVERFVLPYIVEVLGRSPSDTPSADIAEYARSERRSHVERVTERTKVLQDQFRRISDNAAVMKNWGALQSAVGGSLTSMQEEIRRLAQPNELLSESVRHLLNPYWSESWRDLLEASKEQSKVLGRAVRETDSVPAYGADPSGRALHVPEFPSVSETPVGRTADAVEGLAAAGQRIEQGVNAIVAQAGEVSELVAAVSKTIQSESQAFQIQAKKDTESAVRYAQVSLGAAAIALVVSAMIGFLGYGADRADAVAQDQQTERLLAQVQEQNAQLATLVLLQKQQIEAQRPRTVGTLPAPENESSAPSLDEAAISPLEERRP